MKKKSIDVLRIFGILFVFIIGAMVNIGSTDDDDDDADVIGVWKFTSMTEYDDDDGCEMMTFPMTESSGLSFEVYIKITETTMIQYSKISGSELISNGTYTCSAESETYTISDDEITFEGDDGSSTFEISGDTLTVDSGSENGCKEVLVAEKASESDIANAQENCSMFGDD